jgi:hypothetical protein
MGRFQRSERGGGQPDPQEALRRAREAVARERAGREETHAAPAHDEDELEQVEDAMRGHDAREQDGRDHDARARERDG